MEYNYRTGRKDLFDAAPALAMVVLEHTEDDRIFYAVAHEQGAKYWHADGMEGSAVGLIGLYNKTRVVASRNLISGSIPAEKPVPSAGKLERMKQAQKNARTAMNKPKAPPEPAPLDLSPSALAVDYLKAGHIRTAAPKAVEKAKEAPKPAPKPAPASSGGFVSAFTLSKHPPHQPGAAFLTLNRNGNISLSRSVTIDTGELVDVQIDKQRGLIRVGKVSTGGKLLPKARSMTSTALTKMVKIAEGESSHRVMVEEVDGWWLGKVELLP